VRIRGGWQSILALAQAVDDLERMALAESKLECCASQIARIEAVLHTPHAA